MKNKILKSKNFWVILIYIIFLLIDNFALDSKAGDIWDKLKVRILKFKELIKS